MEARAVVNDLATIAVQGGVCAAVGALAGRFLLRINPAVGAIYCAVSVVVAKLVHKLTEPLFFGAGATSASRFLGHVVNLGAGAVLSALFCLALGFRVKFAGALVLTGTLFATSLLVQSVTARVFPKFASKLDNALGKAAQWV